MNMVKKKNVVAKIVEIMRLNEGWDSFYQEINFAYKAWQNIESQSKQHRIS